MLALEMGNLRSSLARFHGRAHRSRYRCGLAGIIDVDVPRGPGEDRCAFSGDRVGQHETRITHVIALYVKVENVIDCSG